MTNQNIAHYKITSKLGQGGMGEVYRATDTKLDREVAIKILPESFAGDPDRVARFNREAKVLAALNHPNIAVIYGIEQSVYAQALIMELVEGETLGERLEREPMTVEEALQCCQQIAVALEAAHEKGIIHRDLKPENIKIDPQGRVKVLDFGLAKTLPPASSTLDSSANPADAPTMTGDYTEPGKVMGTASYMSPEQSRGHDVDRRTDVWAFGCCLYEALTGKKPFKGQTAPDLVAEILKSDPDLTILPPETPSEVLTLLRHCLDKDPRRRLRDLGDIALTLEDAKESSRMHAAITPTKATGKTGRKANASRGWQVAAVLGAVTGALMMQLIGSLTQWGSTANEDGKPRRTSVLTMPLPVGVSLDILTVPINLDVSPDGSQIVFTGRRTDGTSELFLRALDETEATPVRNTQLAVNPFFSDDGKSLGYSLGTELRTTILGGSEHKTIAASDFIHGADWRAGKIVYCLAPAKGQGLTEVASTNGSEPIELTQPDVNNGALNHFFPQILPGNSGLLYTISQGPLEAGRIVAQSNRDSNRLVFVATGSYARYVSSGHIVYGKSGSLWAVPFDLNGFRVTGPEAEVLSRVLVSPFYQTEAYAVSEGGNGTLVYAQEPSQKIGRNLAWIDIEHRKLEPIPDVPVDAYTRVAIPRNGMNQESLVTIGGSRDDIWLQRLDRPGRQNLTHHPSSDFDPTWSHGGDFIYFTSDRNGMPDIFRMRADGGEEVLAIVSDRDRVLYHGDMSPDGSKLVYVNGAFDLAGDIWIYDLKQSENTPWKATEALETSPSFSPNGKWIAYESRLTPSDEITIVISPLSDPQQVIHVAVGKAPKWHPDGDRVFYQDGDDLMMVRLDAANGYRLVGTERIIEVATAATKESNFYDITSDGRRILIITEDLDVPELKQLIVVQNWFEELKRLAPAER